MDFEQLTKILDNPEEFLFNFKNLTHEKRDAYDKGFNAQHPKPNKEYDENGLRYDVEYLGNLGTNLLLVPVEYMARYVDVVTKSHVDRNNDLLIDEIIESDDFTKEDLAKFNATSIGNFAYIYLHSKDRHVRDYMKRNLIQLHVWKVEQLLNYLKEMQN